MLTRCKNAPRYRDCAFRAVSQVTKAQDDILTYAAGVSAF